VFAGEGRQAAILKENFPGLPMLELKGYRIGYSKGRNMFAAKITLQIPKILNAISYEHAWLRRQQEKHHFDVVIADNRYGLYTDTVPSVIMTHQLRIQSGKSASIDNVLQYLHYKYLNRFNECWVVDNERQPCLAGLLSHPAQVPVNTRYIGLLSQMDNRKPARDPRKVLVILSGPEPMRTQLETKLLQQAAGLPQFQFIIAAGAPGNRILQPLPTHIEYHDALNAQGMSALLSEAGLVICRSGYSTLMDLAASGQKALLVPTPGQTEQEYLAAYLSQKDLAQSVSQYDLDLENDINTAMSKEGIKGYYDHGLRAMKRAIDAFIS
jgi:UDP:flavonoid glycosyltransferase YjiC (YdhE family)